MALNRFTLKLSKTYGMLFALYLFSIVFSTMSGYLLGIAARGGGGWYILLLHLLKVLLFLVFIDLYKRKRDVLIKSFVIVGTLFAIHGILQFWLVGFGFVSITDYKTGSIVSYTYAYKDFGILGWARSPIYLPFGIFYRAHSFFFEPIYFASFLGINIGIILMFLRKGTKRNLLIAINFICLLFTMSIAAISAVFVGWFIYSARTRSMKNLFLLLMMFVAFASFFVFYVGIKSKSASFESRVHRLISTSEVILDGYGIVGVGRNTQGRLGAAPADQYMRLLINHGIIGLFSFILLNIYIFRRLKVKAKYFYFPFIFVVMAADIFDHVYYFWIVMAILYLNLKKSSMRTPCYR